MTKIIIQGSTPSKKRCYRCKTIKNSSEFYNNKNKKSGLMDECIICYKEYKKEHYSRHKEYIKNRSLKYYYEHREQVLNTVSNYYYNNKEEITRKIKEYRKTDKWKIVNTVGQSKRQERIKNTDNGTITTNSLVLLLHKQNGKCAICEKLLDLTKKFSVHLDHIIPICVGGEHTLENVQWTCSKCNLGKKKHTYEK